MPKTSVIVDPSGEPFTIAAVPESGYAAPQMVRMTPRGGLQAYFDVSVPSYDNEQHWAMATPLHVNDAANRQRRLTSRCQARYEVTNNCWLDGIVRTLASETIGDIGPSLQLDPSVPEEMRSKIERAWSKWAQQIKLAEKLWTGRRAKAVDGECFFLLVTDRLLQNDIKLNLKVIEADQVGSPWDEPDDEYHYDGVRVSEAGEPIEYYVYRTHPYQSGAHQQHPLGDWYFSTQLIHLYDITRPGQLRGFTECLPCLPLAATLRRFQYATLHAAEKAADISLLMHTTASPDDEDCSKPFFSTYSPVPFERNMLVNLPYGWEATQVKAEHPANNYVEFVRQIVIEMGRAFNMPASVALGDSSDYNYASGRLDFQQFARALEVERKQQIESKLLSRLFEVWLAEYLTLTENTSPFAESVDEYPHRWYWQPRKTDDPEKNAKAVIELLGAGLMADEEYWLEQGKDPETQRAMIERQNKWRSAHGMPAPGNQPGMKPLGGGNTNGRTQSKDGSAARAGWNHRAPLWTSS